MSEREEQTTWLLVWPGPAAGNQISLNSKNVTKEDRTRTKNRDLCLQQKERSFQERKNYYHKCQHKEHAQYQNEENIYCGKARPKSRQSINQSIDQRYALVQIRQLLFKRHADRGSFHLLRGCHEPVLRGKRLRQDINFLWYLIRLQATRFADHFHLLQQEFLHLRRWWLGRWRCRQAVLTILYGSWNELIIRIDQSDRERV